MPANYLYRGFHEEVYIYALERNDCVIYVGQTAFPEQRLKQHKYNLGENLSMVILQKVKGRYFAYDAEEMWVWFYAQKGTLLNDTYNHRKNGLLLTELIGIA